MPTVLYKPINYEEVTTKLQILQKDSIDWVINAVESWVKGNEMTNRRVSWITFNAFIDTDLYIVKDATNYGIYKKTSVKYQEVKALNNKDIYCNGGINFFNWQ